MRYYIDREMRGVAYLLKEEDATRHYEIRNREGRTVAYEEHGKGSKPSLCQVIKEPPTAPRLT
jgi:hypothetical protein